MTNQDTAIKSIILELAKLGAKLSVVDGKLKLNAKKGTIDTNLQKAIRDNKEAIITFIENGSHSQEGKIISTVDRSQPLPLSFPQQRLWFLDQLEGRSPTYNIPCSVVINGRLDDKRAEQALVEIIARHEVLRTVYQEVDGEPRQIRRDTSNFFVEKEDLSDAYRLIEPQDANALLVRLSRDFALQTFDLSKDCMVKAKLVTLNEAKHLLLINMHHIASDGWSSNIFVGEFLRVYLSGAQSLPPLPLQYGDYAVWQKAQSDDFDRHVDYWRDQLSGLEPVLNLPFDRPRPPQQTFSGSQIPVRLETDLVANVRALAKSTNTSVYMVLLAAFQYLLSFYSRSSDIAIGSPVANRDVSQLEPLIGFFVNTLVFRVEVDSSESFVALLDKVKTVALDAFDHQSTPFEHIVDHLKPERSLSYQPFFQNMFSLLNAPFEKGEVEGLSAEKLHIDNGVAKFDMHLSLVESDQGIEGFFEYCTDIFDANTIARMWSHYKCIVREASAAPDTLLKDIDLVSENDLKILTRWNETDTLKHYRSVVHDFSQLAALHPQGTAVSFGSRSLTYHELDVLSNRFAHALISAGVQVDQPVGLSMNRSTDMIVALLGILKAGACYVALDPSYPSERLSIMLEEAQVDVVVVSEAACKRLAPILGERTAFTVNDAQRDYHDFPDSQPEVAFDKLHSAYITFTSGSTGRPKGSVLTHQGLVNLISWQKTHYPIGVGKTCLQFTTVNFDVSFQEIFGTLSGGGELVLVSEDDRHDPEALVDLMLSKAVNYLFCPVIVLQQLAEYCCQFDVFPSNLEVVVTAGDALRVSKEIIHFFDQIPNAELHNHYGPSETHVVTASVFTPEDKPWPSLPHIGKPVDNCKAYVVDEYMQRVPVGVPGELYVGGEQIYRGYCGRPELTAEVCVPDPFSSSAGARLYKTGDLVRFLADGNIQYLGRADSQVKVRGFRVELGEIESLLAQHQNIKNTVVVAREHNDSREKFLVAYVVLDQTDQVDFVQGLRGYLKSQLPDYMVPSFFVPLEEIPKTANGKIDRRALPEPSVDVTDHYVAPETDMERRVSELFKEVLQVEKVGRDADFFDLGGHSLKATKLITRLREQLVGELSVQLVFECPVVSQLAERIEDYPEKDHIAIEVADRSQIIPLSYPQQRLWFLDKLEGGRSSTYSMPLALKVVGNFDVERARIALEALVARHEILRTTFVDADGAGAQKIHDTLAPEFICINEKELDEKLANVGGVEALLKTEIGRSFDLEEGPLLRLLVVVETNDTRYLLFNMHHMISDGWSINNLCAEFCSLYSHGSESDALSLHYADFAVWQRGWLQGEEAKTQLHYWESYLQGLPECLELPLDHARPKAQSYRGQHISIAIPKNLTNTLEHYAKSNGASLFMVLIAAFNVLLSRWSGQKDIAIGSALAGRTMTELEEQIGFYANLWVLRSDLSGNILFSELLKNTKTDTLKAYSNQMLPFDLVVDALQPSRSLSYSPIFQTMFLLHNNADATFSLGDLDVSGFELEFGIAKHDISVNLWPGDEGLFGSLEYATDLFDESTIRELVAAYTLVLEQLCEQPDICIDDFETGLAGSSQQGSPPDTIYKGIRQVLLGYTDVSDCALLASNVRGNSGCIAYVVTNDNMPIERIQYQFETEMPTAFHPKAWVLVSHIPLTKNGAVDESKLRSLPVTNNRILSRENNLLQQAYPDTNIALVDLLKNDSQEYIHLSDVVSDWGWLSANSTVRAELSDSSNAGVYKGREEYAYANGGDLIIPEESPRTLTDALVATAKILPDKGIHFIYLDETESFLSYPDLLKQALSVLGGLQQLGLKPEDAVILQLENTRFHLICFWACVLGGYRPVTVAIAPSYQERNGVVDKLYNIWKLLDKPLVLTNDVLKDSLSDIRAVYDMDGFTIGSYEALIEGGASGQIYPAKPEDVVFYQLTSGSTGVPKCIQETHRGIIHHIHGSAQFCDYSRDDISLNWLPMDHVVPTLTFHLKDTYMGITQVELATQLVLQKPLVWLDALERFAVTHSWSPNFGYKLLSEELLKASDKKRDLSRVKYLMNAGEQVTLPVIEQFLRLVEGFGISQNVMQPSFGMAEACTCMTYQNSFHCDSGIRYFKKASLSDHLMPATSDDPSAIGFIDLGAPVPGVEIRITDSNNQLVKEGQIGRFQIRGAVITPGYYRNTKANDDAFVGDDWFDSGDLGFIWDGRLTLTGRAKETIIVNGANFYCYEIEDVVNSVSGVLPTFSAAVSISNEDLGTEALVVFFCLDNPSVDLTCTIKNIKKDVTKALGVSPSYVIPVEVSEFPKTTSGKIQRVKLKDLLLAGSFNHQIKDIDIALQNENVIPNWFYQERWVRKNTEFSGLDVVDGVYWVFRDASDTLDELCGWLRENHQEVVEIFIGEQFSQSDENRFSINIERDQDFESLVSHLTKSGRSASHVIFDALSARSSNALSEGGYIQQGLTYGVFALNRLLTALNNVTVPRHLFHLMVLGRNAENHLEGSEAILGSLDGWLASASREREPLNVSYIDVTGAPSSNISRIVKSELHQLDNAYVRYREGKRYIRRFANVDLSTKAERAAVDHNGFYIVSGGLGGIGFTLCQWLLREFKARLLILGRPENGDSRQKARKKLLTSLEQLGGDVRFEEADLSSKSSVESAFQKGIQKWGIPDGVFHLAGAYHEATISEESIDAMSSAMQAKMMGAFHLFSQLQESRKDTSDTRGLFVSMSSGLSYFPAAGIATYASANSFLNTFSDYINQSRSVPIDSYCLISSNWDNTGMSSDLPFRSAIEQRGFHFMQPDHAVASVKAILSQAPGSWVFGLDMNKPYLRANLVNQPLALEQTCVVVGKEDAQHESALHDVTLLDYVGRSVKALPTVIESIPLTSDGRIDFAGLKSFKKGSEKASRNIVAPRTSVERRLVRIWQETLGVENVGVTDNFFELGGNSILAVTLLGKINAEFHCELNLTKLFHSQTIELLAVHFEEDHSSAWNPLVVFNSQGERPPLFLVHPGGGWVTSYQTLNTELSDEQPVYGIQAKGVVPGLGSHRTIEEMSEAYAQVITSKIGDGPCHVAGWSLGAMIAYETVKRLHALGAKVENLFLIDSAPHPVNEEDAAILERYDDVDMLIQLSKDSLDPHREKIQQMTPKARVEWVYEHLVEQGQVPEGTGVEHLESLRDEALANAEIRRRGVSEGTLSGVNSVLIVSSEVKAQANGDESLGWGPYIDGEFDRYNIDGRHHKLMESPHVEIIGQALEKYLSNPTKS